MRPYLLALVGLAGLIVPGVAHAQAPSQPAPPSPPGKYPPPEVIAPAPNNADKAAGGVIRPPDVDSGMTVKPPANGPQSMPVIPAPGTPGGNPTVTPK
jgi:hypothetical protein